MSVSLKLLALIIGLFTDRELQLSDSGHGDGRADHIVATDIELDNAVHGAFLNFHNGSFQLVSSIEFRRNTLFVDYSYNNRTLTSAIPNSPGN